MRVEFSPPDITEEEIAEVIDTLKSGWITTGPKTKKFEQEIAQFCGTTKAACLSSATTCMEMTLRAMGIGPGDEVITSAYTFTATCSVICHVGATPVLVDTMPDSIDMDPEKVREAITEKTKAILTIDLAGIICCPIMTVNHNLSSVDPWNDQSKDSTCIQNISIYRLILWMFP